MTAKRKPTLARLFIESSGDLLQLHPSGGGSYVAILRRNRDRQKATLNRIGASLTRAMDHFKDEQIKKEEESRERVPAKSATLARPSRF